MRLTPLPQPEHGDEPPPPTLLERVAALERRTRRLEVLLWAVLAGTYLEPIRWLLGGS